MNILDEFFVHISTPPKINFVYEPELLEDRNPIFIPDRHTKMTYAAQNRAAKQRRKAKNGKKKLTNGYFESFWQHEQKRKASFPM